MTCDICGKPSVGFWAFRVWRCCSETCRDKMEKRFRAMWKRDVSNTQSSYKVSHVCDRESGTSLVFKQI